MAARSLASLMISFGLVNVPVKLYSATEPSGSVRFNLLAKDGSRLKQQYVSESTGKVVERAEMVKGYEFEKDRFVMFSPDELKAMDESANHVIEIVAVVPELSVDPLYYDKAYLLAPDKRGGKPYWLLAQALRDSQQCALARWTFKGKQYVAQIRGLDDGLLLQQLLYADEVRSLRGLDIERVEVGKAELELAKQLLEQIAQDAYDPAQFKDDERQRILAAIDRKIAGKEVVTSTRTEEPVVGAQVIDLMDALRASLGKKAAAKAPTATRAKAAADDAPARKPARRAPKQAQEAEAAEVAQPVKARARK